MKSKHHPKKNHSTNGDKFDRKSSKAKPTHGHKESKRRLSIYDEFDDEDLDNFNYGLDED